MPQTNTKKAFTLLVCMGVIGAVFRDQPPERFEGSVSRIINGDTLTMRAREASIRLWGVRCPEKSEKGFYEAKNALFRMASNQVLQCEQVDVDRYRRAVARCWRQDGQEINQMMIESGTATEYLHFSNGAYSR